MISLKENSALAFKYIYWGLILIALCIGFGSRLWAWGGFAEPIDVHVHLEPHKELGFDGEKWLQDNADFDIQERESDSGGEGEKAVENDPD